jgi:hypothetical protein
VNLAIALTLWTIGVLAARRVVYIDRPGDPYQVIAIYAVLLWLAVAGAWSFTRIFK